MCKLIYKQSEQNNMWLAPLSTLATCSTVIKPKVPRSTSHLGLNQCGTFQMGKILGEENVDEQTL